jgi:hypothetical protein
MEWYAQLNPIRKVDISCSMVKPKGERTRELGHGYPSQDKRPNLWLNVCCCVLFLIDVLGAYLI